jgi:hypothetical protein
LVLLKVNTLVEASTPSISENNGTTTLSMFVHYWVLGGGREGRFVFRN